jgi:hypothetical protein
MTQLASAPQFGKTFTLRELHPDRLWIVDEPFSRAGIEIGARMTIVKLDDGGLWLHSPFTPDEELKQILAELGEVRALVSPNAYHFLGIAAAKEAYPQAHVFVMPPFTERYGVPVDEIETLSDDVPEAWSGDLDQILVRGGKPPRFEEAVFFDATSRTLILTDLFFNLGPHLSTRTRLVARALGVYAHPAPSRFLRLFLRDHAALRITVRRIAEWDFDRIILAHGDILERGAKERFLAAFNWLKA